MWPQFCPAVLREFQEPVVGAGAGGLLLLAECTDCPLLLEQQARKRMS